GSPLSCSVRRRPTSTLLPYTTLFRSNLPAPGRADSRQTHRGDLAPDDAPGGGSRGRRFGISGRRAGGKMALPGRNREGACPRRKDRKSTRLNSSHVSNSYAVFCLKKN